jgi:hypothetical protein
MSIHLDIIEKWSSCKDQISDQQFFNEFEFVKSFNNGSHSKTGIIRHKTTGILFVYKSSLKPDFWLRHENSIYQKINSLSNYCPNYCQGVGLIKMKLNYCTDYKITPFSESYSKIFSELLLTEYISGSKNFTLEMFGMSPAELYSSLFQILISIEIGYRNYGFVHYDLHTSNILIKDIDKNNFFLYLVGEHKILIPTYGIVPKIIDNGFSYCKNSNTPLYSNMEYTDCGNLGCISDRYYDPRILLVNMADIIGKFDKPNNYQHFLNFIQKMYTGLNYHPSRGWDDNDCYSASDMICYTINEFKVISKFLSVNQEYSVNLFQSLIILPLKDHKNGDFRSYYTGFAKEFVKFERSVQTDLSKKIILRDLIDTARPYLYVQNSGKQFELDFFDRISKSLNFYNPPLTVNWNNILINLRELSKCISTIYFRIMYKISVRKKEIYSELKTIKTPLEIVKLLEDIFMPDYKLTEKIIISVFDSNNQRTELYTNFPLNICAEFNKLKISERGKYLFDNLNKGKKA